MGAISVKVPAEPRQYQVLPMQEIDALHQSLFDQVAGRDFVVLTDENVAQKTQLIPMWAKENVLVLPAGESYKRLETVAKMAAFASAKGLTRNSVFIAIGGGVIGDMTGFAASMYMRGVVWIGVPTTLLSMVDSSVGGKTGVDTDYGKNLLGAFYPPEAVLVCHEALITLPHAEVQNGIAEMIKHGIVADETHFKALETLAVKWDGVVPLSLILASIQIKKAVVEADYKESGQRMHLNLGHTFGHAIEHKSAYAVPHGAAVAMGLCMAADKAFELGICDAFVRERIYAAVAAFGLKTQSPYVLTDLYSLMKTDKKRIGTQVHFVLPEAIGRAGIYPAALPAAGPSIDKA